MKIRFVILFFTFVFTATATYAQSGSPKHDTLVLDKLYYLAKKQINNVFAKKQKDNKTKKHLFSFNVGGNYNYNFKKRPYMYDTTLPGLGIYSCENMGIVHYPSNSFHFGFQLTDTLKKNFIIEHRKFT